MTKSVRTTSPCIFFTMGDFVVFIIANSRRTSSRRLENRKEKKCLLVQAAMSWGRHWGDQFMTSTQKQSS